jgi:hypothetical protein
VRFAAPVLDVVNARGSRGRAVRAFLFPPQAGMDLTVAFALPRDAEHLAETGGFVFLGSSRSDRYTVADPEHRPISPSRVPLREQVWCNYFFDIASCRRRALLPSPSDGAVSDRSQYRNPSSLRK